jgi:hypothetical protein
MSPPCFLLFTPVPLRARCDGWDPALQLRFIELLAAGARPGEAALALGKNRQNAYALRRRPGSQSFAAAWDAAAASGRRARAAKARPGPKRAPVVLPQGPRAEAIVALGQHEIDSAASPDEARAALGRMLDGLYGPKGSTATTATKGDPGSSSPGGPDFQALSRHTVAFRRPPVRRHPC